MRISRFVLLSLLAPALASVARATPTARFPEAELPEPGAEDLALSARIRAQRGVARSELSGLFSLRIPLERFATPRTATVSNAALTSAPAPDEAALSHASAPHAEPAEEALPLAPLLAAPALARLARESVAAALRARRVAERRRELSAVAARARLSALLPELRVRAQRSHDESLRLVPTQDDPYRATLAGGEDLVLEASATWKLNTLVFADEEIAVERLRNERDAAAERFAQNVLRAVLAWHRALAQARTGTEAARGRAELERLEAEVELDVSTDGWFTREAARLLAEARRATRAEPREPEPRGTTPDVGTPVRRAAASGLEKAGAERAPDISRGE